ncbi:MAG TPA: hypothetical protein VNL69_02485 [Bacteroidota bacterium]|nr:hypothetical protein [Bacteroidota bacterium]
MDFLLWATRSMHVFGVIVWCGGLLYQSIITRDDDATGPGTTAYRFILLFQPYVWMSVWTILITGVALMLFSPRYVFLRFEDAWSVLLGLKQVTFVLMVVCAFGHARMMSRVEELLARGTGDEKIQPYYRQMLRLGKTNVILALLAVVLAAGMSRP